MTSKTAVKTPEDGWDWSARLTEEGRALYATVTEIIGADKWDSAKGVHVRPKQNAVRARALGRQAVALRKKLIAARLWEDVQVGFFLGVAYGEEKGERMSVDLGLPTRGAISRLRASGKLGVR